jgi:uncharacterized membrane protein
MPKLKGILNALVVILSIVYPFVWYFGQAKLGVTPIALLMAMIWLLRALLSQHKTQQILSYAAMLVFVFFAWAKSSTGMYWYPVWVSAMLLALFAGSLLAKQSVIERLARLQHPNLPSEGVRYTRKVTIIWCVFFVFNMGVTSGLILGEYWQMWALYTGLLSYGLMGILLGGEYVYRRWVLKVQYEH